MDLAAEKTIGFAKLACLVVLVTTAGVFGYSLGRESADQRVGDRVDQQLDVMMHHLERVEQRARVEREAPAVPPRQVTSDAPVGRAISALPPRRNRGTNS